MPVLPRPPITPHAPQALAARPELSYIRSLYDTADADPVFTTILAAAFRPPYTLFLPHDEVGAVPGEAGILGAGSMNVRCACSRKSLPSWHLTQQLGGAAPPSPPPSPTQATVLHPR